MEVRVLGPTQVRRGPAPVDLGTRKQRALIAALAMHRGRAVPVDLIVDLLWGDSPPPGVATTLQAYVAGLRRSLEPDRERRAPATVLVTVGAGYGLQVERDQVDAVRFTDEVQAQHRRLGAAATLLTRPSLGAPDLEDLVVRLDAALELWRGEPYLELEDAPDAIAERTRLAELRLIALEDRAVANLGLGHHATVAAELEQLTGMYPLRERLWGLRALALTRCGRQAEALDVLAAVRQVLDTELGLEPSAELRSLQTSVLRQDPALDWTAPAGPASVPDSPERADHPVAAATDTHAATGWPMVGRAAQLDTLTALLDRADQGRLGFASITGEPGIGKTRLANELIATARARGVRVLAGRCSQDEGAPPLWPWAAVLRGLGEELPAVEAGSDAGAQFRVWDAVSSAVLAAAAERTTLVVLDDLHWADPATLRVLRLMVESDVEAKLLVVNTRRDFPEPTGPLADVVEMLARRHAERIRLDGLSAVESAQIVERVARERPSDAHAGELRERTDGNPFFLVEFARLAAERGDLEALLAEDNPPTAVQDVLVRRIERLPEATQTLLRTAAVIGRQFEGSTLGRTSGESEDVVFDLIEPARRAGLVREEAIDEFTFAHALVRDTLYAGWSPSRRARVHAKVAAALPAGRETEQARHWLAAGPQHAAVAWRSAVRAAELVRRLHAHEQSAGLLTAALDRMAKDPDATPRERYDVVMQLADAHRWLANWPDLKEQVEEAITVAESMGDVELVALAATSTTIGALWQSAPHGGVNAKVVAALRSCLTRLPAVDDPLRCRVMLSLANELYYGALYPVRRQLVDEALAMADRLDDPELRLDANQVAFAALWCPPTAEERLQFASEAMRLAEQLGREQAYVVSVTLRAVVEGELGLVEQMWTSSAIARREATRLRLPYGLIVVESLELPWVAMAGRFEECHQRVAEIQRLDEQMSLEMSGDATAGAMIATLIWEGRGAEIRPIIDALAQGPLPVGAIATALLLRVGDQDAALEFFRSHPIDLEPSDWFSMLNWGYAAESALWLDDAELADRAYAKLEPYAGRSCCAGSGNASGPIDAFLAMAAQARGDHSRAAEHAERATELLRRWQIPLAEQWFADQRARFGF